MRWELVAGLSLSAACLVGALGHLAWFMWQAHRTMAVVHKLIGMLPGTTKTEFPEAKILRSSVAATVALVRLSLISTGIMVAVAFGFLGFALFLMGINDVAKLSADVQGSQLVLENAAPGLIVLVVAAVLIGVCVVQRVEAPLEPENKVL